MSTPNEVPKFHPQIPQSQENPQNYIVIPGPVFGNLSKYLDSKPHGEVRNLMQMLNEHSFNLKSLMEYQIEMITLKAKEKSEEIKKEKQAEKAEAKKKPAKKKKTKK